MKIIKNTTLITITLASIAVVTLPFLSGCEFENVDPDDDDGNITNVNFSPFVELNTLGGTVSFANAINNNGIIVGESNDGDGNRKAFVADDQMVAGVPGSLFSESSFLNIDPDAPLNVGYGVNSAGFDRPILQIDNDQIIELEMGDQGDSGGKAMAVGNGDIVGIGALPFVGRNLPVLWDASFTGEILFCLDSSDTYDIDQLYFIDYVDALTTSIVLASSGSNPGTGYIWEPFVWTELATNEYPNIIPRDINNSAQIAVTAYDANGDNFPAIYKDGTITLLNLPAGFIGGNAFAINDNGEVVGEGFNGSRITPIYWNAAGEPTDLNDLLNISAEERSALGYDPYIINAKDINENGDITGEGYFNVNDPDAGTFGGGRQREAYFLPASAL